MPTSEARAMLLLLALAVLGQGVRHFLTRPGQPPGQVQLWARCLRPRRAPSVIVPCGRGRPLGPTERMNVDLRIPDRARPAAPSGLRLAKVSLPIARRTVPSAPWQASIGCRESAPDCSKI